MAAFVSSNAVEQRRERFSGEVFEPGSPCYEGRQVHNWLTDKRSGLIARGEGTLTWSTQ
jgi:hypothetical protein